MKNLQIFGVLLLMAAWPATLVHAVQMEDQFPKARVLFYRSIEDESQIDRAIELFEHLKQHSIYTGRATVYIGALTAIKGKFAFWPHNKLKYAKQGLKIMDEGITSSPDDIEALFIHGSTCHFLPFFFNRGDDAKRYFRQIVALLPEQAHLYPNELIKNVVDFLVQNAELSSEETDKILSIRHKIELYSNAF